MPKTSASWFSLLKNAVENNPVTWRQGSGNKKIVKWLPSATRTRAGMAGTRSLESKKGRPHCLPLQHEPDQLRNQLPGPTFCLSGFRDSLTGFRDTLTGFRDTLTCATQ